MNIKSLSKHDAFVNTRVKELFIAQANRPPSLKDINITRLTPFQRALLITDGTVTRFIEAYKLSPVQVILLYQARRTLRNEHVWLKHPTGGKIFAREVILQTPSTDNQTPNTHAYAVSQIVYERLPKNVVEGLEAGFEGLGALLQNSKLETRRDLLWWGIERVTGLPSSIAHFEGQLLINRTYRIVANGNPLMLITEKFPLDDT